MKRVTKKEWFLDRYCNQQFAALVEEGELKEFHMEEEPRTDIVGNIYKGKVVNVLAGMNAAFVNCGFDRLVGRGHLHHSVIATGNQLILIHCAEHHPADQVKILEQFDDSNALGCCHPERAKRVEGSTHRFTHKGIASA